MAMRTTGRSCGRSWGNPFRYQHAAFVILPKDGGFPAGIGSRLPEPTP